MEFKYLHIFLVFSLQIFVALNQPAPSTGKLLYISVYLYSV